MKAEPRRKSSRNTRTLPPSPSLAPRWKGWRNVREALATAVQYQKAGCLKEAEAIYRQILEIHGDNAEALYVLGRIAFGSGRSDIAVEFISKAISLNDTNAAFHNDLGVAFTAWGNLDKAIASYRRAITIEPGNADAHSNLGYALREKGKLEEAIAYCQQAITIKPDYDKAHINLGNALADQGKLDAAVEHYEQALRLNPDCPETYYNLGNALVNRGQLDAAIQQYREALRLKTDYADAHNSLGHALKSQGRLDEALEEYRQALKINPYLARAHSNLLLSLQYMPGINRAQMFAEHQRWAEQHAAPLVAVTYRHGKYLAPERRLKVGYVSPDFCAHSVAFFIEPVIVSHDRAKFEVICYADVPRPDTVTEALQHAADGWRNIARMTDEQVAGLVRSDGIDILVDLAGHTARNRMCLFARKPAPLQVTYLGYPDTSGLPTMDYRITDFWADPQGQMDHLYVEELVRLPKSFLCYHPRGDSPEASTLPALGNGHVTFGSFNNRCKVNHEVVEAWSSILEKIPDSILILKARALADEETRQILRKMFVKHGVAPNRIELFSPLPFVQHLQLYNRIDIGLDTFPYNGTTTTCEALWMGVPVIVLAGKHHASRVGVSLLWNVGIPDLIAKSTEDYVEKATQLAHDLEQVRDLRANLRCMMLKSSLMDAKGMTRSLEDAYRWMWRRWCSQACDRNPEKKGVR